MSWREEILQRNPIDEYLRREGYKVRLGRGSFLADDACPVATHKPGHPVRIDARNHRWRCDSCQQSGSVIEWVALKKGITAGEAKLELNGNELPPFVRVLIASAPKRGEGRLNGWFFRVARYLHAFLSENESIELLGAVTFGEPIRPGEIERAVANSKKCAWKPGEANSTIVQQPKWPKVDEKKREAVIDSGGGLVDLWERSPVRLDDDQPRTEEIIDALFPGNPFLCVGLTNQNFDTRTRNEWRGKLATQQLIVPSPMTARRGKTKGDKTSAHTLQATGPRRFLVIEQDAGDADEQAAILLHLTDYAPLVLTVHSGKKSIHGWFICRDESEETLREFMEYAVQLGADPAHWTRSQFTRMPDGVNDKTGKRQTVFYFDPEQLA